jgi:hypothetical protein
MILSMGLGGCIIDRGSNAGSDSNANFKYTSGYIIGIFFLNTVRITRTPVLISTDI